MSYSLSGRDYTNVVDDVTNRLNPIDHLMHFPFRLFNDFKLGKVNISSAISQIEFSHNHGARLNYLPFSPVSTAHSHRVNFYRVYVEWINLMLDRKSPRRLYSCYLIAVDEWLTTTICVLLADDSPRLCALANERTEGILMKQISESLKLSESWQCNGEIFETSEQFAGPSPHENVLIDGRARDGSYNKHIYTDSRRLLDWHRNSRKHRDSDLTSLRYSSM